VQNHHCVTASIWQYPADCQKPRLQYPMSARAKLRDSILESSISRNGSIKGGLSSLPFDNLLIIITPILSSSYLTIKPNQTNNLKFPPSKCNSQAPSSLSSLPSSSALSPPPQVPPAEYWFLTTSPMADTTSPYHPAGNTPLPSPCLRWRRSPSPTRWA